MRFLRCPLIGLVFAALAAAANVPLGFTRLSTAAGSSAFVAHRHHQSTTFTADGFRLRWVGAHAGALRMQLAHSNPRAEASGESPSEGIHNLYQGADPSQWQANIPIFSKLRFRSVYPGIDVVYYSAENGNLEYDFQVAPGARVTDIVLSFPGASGLGVNPTGHLDIAIGPAAIQQLQPLAYQDVQGVRRGVTAVYRITGPHDVAIDVGSHDETLPLIIDPTLVFSTYLGGSDFDEIFGMVLDSSGNIYLTGQTASTNFPSRTGGTSGNRDVYIAKLNPTGTSLLYLTVLGGAQTDSPHAIAVDTSGNAYVTGYTLSSDFPTTAGAYKTVSGGSEDAFVVKLNSTGAVVFSTYLGAAGRDFGTAIAVDGSGDSYVAGYTSSAAFPVFSTAYQSSYSGGFFDAFVTKLNPSGSALIYSTLLGGSGNDTASSIALDASRNVYVCGQTDSTNFPLSAGALQSSNAGGSDVFVTKLDATATTAIFSTYLGGSSNELASQIVVDASGNVYLAGASASVDFPVSATAYQPSNAGFYDAFAVKLNPTGNAIVFSTLLGAAGSDQATGLAIDTAGNVWLTGTTTSAIFPLVNPFQASPGGGIDVFVATLNSTGDQLVASTYLGGAGDDSATSIAVDNQGSVLVAGLTASPNFPVSSGVVQPIFGGSNDGFLFKMQTGLCPTMVNPTSLSVGVGGASGIISISIPAGCGAVTAKSNVSWASVSVSGASANWAVTGNQSSLVRAGTLTVASQTVGITQDGGSCVYTLNPTVVNSASAAASGIIAVTPVPANCPTAVVIPNAPWISVAILGNTATWTITADPSALSRTGTFTVGGQTVTIVQAGAPCSYIPSPPSISVGATGSSGILSIAATPSDCAPTAATSNVGWASVSVLGNTAPWAVNPTPSSQPRNGSFTVGGQGVAVSEAGAACSYALNPANLSVGAAAMSGNIAITPTPSDCAPAAASSNVTWASVTVSGNTAFWSITANVIATTRSGSLSIGGQNVAVAQAAMGCSYSLNAGSITAPAIGANGIIAITPFPSNCPSAPATSGVIWASISSSGNTAPWSVSANTGSSSRTGSFSIAGQTVPVTQNGLNPPTLGVSHSTLTFGVSGSTITGPQVVSVIFTGGAGAWTVSSNRSNITVVPASGNGSGSFVVSAAAGSSGIITVSAPEATNPSVPVQVAVANVTPSLPFGSLDTPADGVTGIAGAIAITGWALDRIQIDHVDIWREPVGVEPPGLVLIGNALFVDNARPDVETANPGVPFNYRAGWGYLLLTNFLPNNSGSAGPGNGTYRIHAIAHGKTGGSQELGAHAVTVDNAHASRPFGSIDTPNPGDTVSGSSFVNFGWALTQNPFIIPMDGSTITVTVDGVPLGHPTYNQYRVDISTAFPGLANSSGPVGYFFIDTTQLTDGIHTIAWLVYDNAGRGDGIGSRYFTVLNGGIVAINQAPPLSANSSELVHTVTMEELTSIELPVGATTGHMEINGDSRPLPIGSNLKDGVFRWHPGPGFMGRYKLVFQRPGQPDLEVPVTIIPQ